MSCVSDGVCYPGSLWRCCKPSHPKNRLGIFWYNEKFVISLLKEIKDLGCRVEVFMMYRYIFKHYRQESTLLPYSSGHDTSVLIDALFIMWLTRSLLLSNCGEMQWYSVVIVRWSLVTLVNHPVASSGGRRHGPAAQRLSPAAWAVWCRVPNQQAFDHQNSIRV